MRGMSKTRVTNVLNFDPKPPPDQAPPKPAKPPSLVNGGRGGAMARAAKADRAQVRLPSFPLSHVNETRAKLLPPRWVLRARHHLQLGRLAAAVSRRRPSHSAQGGPAEELAGGYAIIGCAGRGLKTLFEKLGHEHSVLLTLILLLYLIRCPTRQKKGHAGFNGVAKVQ